MDESIYVWKRHRGIRGLRSRLEEIKKDLVKIDDLIKTYEDEIGKIDRNEGVYASMDPRAKASRRDRFAKEMEALKTYHTSVSSSSNNMTDLFNRRNASSVDRGERRSIDADLENNYYDIVKARKEFESRTQGSRTDIVSAYAFNIDKRLHNRLYANNKARWDNHVITVNNRYKTRGLITYSLTRGAVVAALGLAVVPAITTAFSVMAPIVGTLATLGAVAYGAKVVSTVASTIYNRIKYGQPRLVQKYEFAKGPGSYSTNLSNAKNKRTGIKNLINNFQRALAGEFSNRRRTAPAPTSPAPTSISPELANIISKINACNLSDLSENNIKNNLYPVQIAARGYVDRLPNDVKTKYNSIKQIVTNYMASIRERKAQELEEFINEINNCNVTDLSENNIRNSLYLTYIKTKSRFDEFPEPVKQKFIQIQNVVNNYINAMREQQNRANQELQNIINEINSCNITDLSEKNILTNIYRICILSKNRLAELPEDIQNKYHQMEEIVKDYVEKRGARREAEDKKNAEIRRINSELSVCSLKDKSKENLELLRHIYLESREYEADLSPIAREKLEKIDRIIRNSYGNIGIPKNVDADLNFQKAVSIVRDDKASAEDKAHAIGLLATRFGQGKSSSKKSSKGLSDFNRTQKDLAFLARSVDVNLQKLNEAKTNPIANRDEIRALEESIDADTRKFAILLYHFAEVDIPEDWIADEYDRYAEDMGIETPGRRR